MSEDAPPVVDPSQPAQEGMAAAFPPPTGQARVFDQAPPTIDVPGFDRSPADVARDMVTGGGEIPLPPPAARMPQDELRRPERRITEPETRLLKQGERFVMDAMADTIPPAEFDLPEVASGTQEITHIAGSIGLMSNDPEKPELTLPIVRMEHPKWKRDLFYILGPDRYKTQEGRDVREWVPLYPTRGVAIGRNPNVSNALNLDDKMLLGDGYSFSEGISRHHLTVTMEQDTIVVTDYSSNNTLVKGAAVGAKSPRSQQTTSGVSSKSSPANLISSVPQSDEEARAVLNRQAGTNGETAIDARIAEIDQKAQEINDGLSPDDGSALWGYWTGLINRAEQQALGNEAESTNEYRKANEALKRMSPKAQAVKDEYLRLMQQKYDLEKRR